MLTEHDGIKIIHNIEKSLVELDTAANGVTTDLQFVKLIIKFQPYLNFKKIKYFVLNQKNNNFDLSPQYYKFRYSIFIMDLLEKGTEQIFFMVPENKKEKYRKELPDYIRVVSEYEEIDELIKTQVICVR